MNTPLHGGLGIYIHVPFCAVKCGYCSFCSVGWNSAKAEGYVQAVLRNIRDCSDTSRPADTVYFGGGTPSLLRPEQIAEITGELRRCFAVTDDAEITLEANPNTLSPERLHGYLEAGINRLSVGVQSLDDEELRLLGRKHTAERAEKAVRDAAEAGFTNISCDLMLALPGQSPETAERSVDRLAELPIQHISSYLLKVEDGTPFHSSGMEERLPDDDKTAELYLRAVRRLESHGFMQYEISNFAREGYESRHNNRYWLCEDYIGIGPSAHSCCGGKRYAVPPDVDLFISSPVQATEITDEAPCSPEEMTMLALRLKSGLDLRRVESIRSGIEKKIPALVSAGLCVFDGENLSLTPEGFLVSNSVIAHLI
ncbi:MAG: radical SAM family heme chaperone HemW [Ruminococcus sp.]|nr:radical SAM family heme chaperone HemW [Ruminococcus sp.]